MGALEVLVSDILCEAGLKKVDVRTRTALELPGYFGLRKNGISLSFPTARWSWRWSLSPKPANRSATM